MFIAAAFVAALAACGARSELDVGRGEGGTPPPAPFATLPCRWTVGRETVVSETPEGPLALAAAVHGDRDVVLVLAEHGAGARASVLTLADPPERRADEPVTYRADELLSAPGGWLAIESSPRCRVARIDDGLAVAESLEPNVPDGCASYPASLAALDVVALVPAPDSWCARRCAIHVQHVRVGATLAPEPALEVPLAAGRASAAFDEALGWFVASTGGGERLALRRFALDGTELDRLIVATETTDLGFAPDRLRAGIAVLRAGAEGSPAFVERIPFEPELRIEPVTALPETFHIVGGRGGLVTNETEALVPLRDGRVAVAALNGITPSTLGPVIGEDAELRQIVVALRTGTSVGGIAYVYRPSADGLFRVAFRGLVCNR